jgi:hypothetical protein
VVAELEALMGDGSGDGVAVFDGEGLEESDAAGAVHDVQALALEVDVSGDVLAVDFVGAEVDALFDEVGAGVDQLADALA